MPLQNRETLLRGSNEFVADEEKYFFSNLVRETYVINPEFEGVNPRELMDTTVNGWVHHCLNILPQVSGGNLEPRPYTDWRRGYYFHISLGSMHLVQSCGKE